MRLITANRMKTIEKHIKFYSILFISFLSFTACNSQEKKSGSELSKSIEKGALVYEDFCMTCHMPNGKGVPKTFPPLANSDYLKNKREASIRAIKYGQKGEIIVNGETYKGVMSPLGLSDEEVADVMNYISNTWDNKNDTLTTPEEVSKVKPIK